VKEKTPLLNIKQKPAVTGGLRSKRQRPSIICLASQTNGLGSDTMMEDHI